MNAKDKAIDLVWERIKQLRQELNMALDSLTEYRKAQGRMLDGWAEGDEITKNGLWRSLHDCQLKADIVLTQYREEIKP